MEYFLVLLTASINSIYCTNQKWLNVFSIRRKCPSVGLKIVVRYLAGEIDFRCQTKINEVTSSDTWDMALFSWIILGQNVQVAITSS